jgi:lipoprotein-anchoring transpeptidase ErfK/SrfK
MGRASFVITATLVALLLGGAVGVYAYDSSRSDMVAEGVTVGGVDVGGMSADEARAALRRKIKQPLERSIRVSASGGRFELSAKEAELRTDVAGMVDDALAESRDGNILSRAYRDLTGGTVDADLPSRVTYSRRAVEGLVEDVEEEVNRSAQDAEVVPSGAGLETTEAQNGVEVESKRLTRRVSAELESPDSDRRVRATTEMVKPEVTESELADEHPYYLTVDRSAFQLHFYENLELVETYTIAVGQVGFDTPAGLYHIQNKAVDPAWNVPNAAWAGDLAGTVVPGGTPENPLKERWMGIYDGAGIHGTDDVGSLGSAASHGCIRMSIPDVIELYDQVPVQTPIYIG